jgi:hypothetical protein
MAIKRQQLGFNFLGVLAILGGLFYSNNLFGNSNNNI